MLLIRTVGNLVVEEFEAMLKKVVADEFEKHIEQGLKTVAVYGKPFEFDQYCDGKVAEMLDLIQQNHEAVINPNVVYEALTSPRVIEAILKEIE